MRWTARRTTVRWTWGLPAILLLGCDTERNPTDPVETVASVEITPTELELAPGDTARLAAIALATDGEPVTGRTFGWTSDHEAVASVDGSGLVSAHGEGVARITASTAGRARWAEVRVTAPGSQVPAIASIEPASIQAGWGSFTLTVRGTGFSPFSRVRWNGMPLESVVIDATQLRATVSASYVVQEGTAEISVETPYPVPMSSNPLAFTVHSRPAHSVDLLVAGNAVFVQNRVKLDALARDQFGEVIVGKVVEWSSSDPNVARIEGGYLRGLTAGTITLTASATPATRSTTYRVLSAPDVEVIFDGAGGTANVPELFVRSLQPGAGLSRILPLGFWAMQPAPGPDGSRIALAHPSDGENVDVWVVNRDGSGLQRLTTHPSIDDQPAWSPDGRWIAFRSFRDGKSDVWAMRSDGSEQRNLTFASVFVPEEFSDAPAWSPDGQRIAFSRGFGSGQALFVMRADGTELRQLLWRNGFDVLAPAWSPDGQTLAFQLRDRATGSSRVEFASSDTGEAVHYFTDFPPDAATPAWLDDAWIAVSARAHPGWPSPTVALVRLGAGHVVVPVGVEYGRLTGPAALPR